MLFKVSHSLGDGVPLIRVLRELLCENPNELEPLWTTPVIPECTTLQKVNQCVLNILQWIGLAIITPHVLVCEALKQPDRNCLRPKRFTGVKVISWVHESDIDVPLFETLKEARRKYPGTRYNEVVAAVVSRGIKSYFEAKSIEFPKHVNISIPEQVVRPGKLYIKALL